MKVNKFFLAGVAVLSLGMTACNNDDVPSSDKVTDGTTFAGMYISTTRNATRVNDSQEDYAGRAAESKLATLDLLSSVKNQNWAFGTVANEAGKFWEKGANSGIFQVAPWKTNPGNQTMALLFNRGSITADIATATNYAYGSTTTAVADIAALATDDGFVMTSSSDAKNVAEGIKEADVKAGTDETKNVFSFDVERVVAQGLVAKATGLVKETADGKGEVDLGTLKYVAINGAAKTYMFRNHAGDRTIGTDGLYKNFASAIDEYTEFEAAKNPTGNAQGNLIRLGNLGTTEAALGGYAAKAVAADVAAAKTARGIYFLENSVKKDAFTAANKNFGFYRMACAKVYATYTPKEVWKLDTDGKTLVKEAGTKGKDFYLGAEDGIVYASKAAAKKSQLKPGQKSYTYTKGKCAYRALWNRQTDATGKTVLSADARRNNTYLLTIKSFQGLGMPWDPSDPSDPYLPKPDPNPEGPDPETPDNPDIEKEETFMRVEAKVLQWNLVSREVNLE